MKTGIYWLSFCNDDAPKGKAFLGVAIVPANDFVHAAKVCWNLGINPGGQVAGGELLGPKPAKKWQKRLLSKEDLKEAGFI